MSLQIIKLWLLQSACDISLNVFHIAENRYILQNNIAEFRGNVEPINSLQKRIKSYPKNVRKEVSLQRIVIPYNKLVIWCFLQIASLLISGLWIQSSLNGYLILDRSHPLSSEHCVQKNHLPTTWNSWDDSPSLLWYFPRSSADPILRRSYWSLSWVWLTPRNPGSQIDVPDLFKPNVVKDGVLRVK